MKIIIGIFVDLIFIFDIYYEFLTTNDAINEKNIILIL